MPPFLHKCLACGKLWYTRTERGTCPKCGSTRRNTFRVTPHTPERSSRRELVLFFGGFVLAALLLVLLA